MRCGGRGVPPSSRCREQKHCPRAFPLQRGGDTGTSSLPRVGDPGSSNSGHRKQEGAIKGRPCQQEWTLSCELSLQKYSLKSNCRCAHCQGERPLREGWVGGSTAKGALTAGNGGGGEALPGGAHRRVEEGEEHHRGCSSTEGRAPPGREAGTRRKRNWARES